MADEYNGEHSEEGATVADVDTSASVAPSLGDDVSEEARNLAETTDNSGLLSLSVQSTAKNTGSRVAVPGSRHWSLCRWAHRLRELLENLDPNTGMAFVLATHLSTEHRSHLGEIPEPVHQDAGTSPWRMARGRNRIIFTCCSRISYFNCGVAFLRGRTAQRQPQRDGR
jgi:hypothetical protein